jgi:hypothetical protein
MVGYADVLLNLSTDINGPTNGDNSVRKVSRLEDLEIEVRFLAVVEIFFSQQRPDRLQGPPIFLSIQYRGVFPQVNKAGA